MLRTLRPRQWPKNLLVAAAPAAAGGLTSWSVAWRTAVATLAFTAVASAMYLVNDTIDAPSDHLHPVKKGRPIASGAVSGRTAIAAAAALLALGLAVGALTGWSLAIVLLAYAATTGAYSLGLKRVPVLEMALVASGFVLRAIAGGAACRIAISPWFLVVTSGAAFLIVAGKRQGEVAAMKEAAPLHRPVLAAYPPGFLFAARLLASAVTTTAYCLWVFERASHVGNAHTLLWFELSIIPFVLGLLAVERGVQRHPGVAPEELALRDRALQAAGVGWLALIVVGIYG